MNKEELRDTLNKMSDKKVSDFTGELGVVLKDRPEIEKAFVDHPEYERRMAQILGLKSEEEKRTQAVIETAKAANEAAKGSKCAAIAALITALISLSVLLIKLFKN